VRKAPARRCVEKNPNTPWTRPKYRIINILKNGTFAQSDDSPKPKTECDERLQKESGGRFRDRRKNSTESRSTLDDVDLSRQIRGNLEADFLLANRGLHPGLHGVSPMLKARSYVLPFMSLKLRARAAPGQSYFP
jgi:hypothetical protein